MNRTMMLVALALASACATERAPEHVHAVPSEEAAPSSAPQEHAGHGEHAGHEHAGAAPSGFAPITIAPAQAGAIGLATAVVEERDFKRTLRTSGVVAVDETRTAHVHPKVRGFVETVAASFTGKPIKAGEALCSIYSQEVLAAELEHLTLFERGVPAQGEFAAAEAKAQQQLVEASRRRFALWDVPKAEIARLEAEHTARRTFSLSAPRAGVVVKKDVIEGMYVEPSMELFTIADLSRVWILADVYEADVPFVHEGDHAHLSVEGVEKMVHAKLAFLPPSVDEATRTLKARFEVDNESGQLRPGAFVSATMDLGLGRGLAVPDTAVVRTGTRSIVFVVEGDRVTPREVKLGPKVGDVDRVDDGLHEGEHVAVSAQFLLDAESRLKATSGPAGGHVH